MTDSKYPSMPVNRISPGHPIRLVLFVKAFPRRSETFIVQKFLGLLEQGWDVHIVCNHSTAEEWRLFPQLPDWKELHHRVHVTHQERAKFVEALLFPFLFLRSLLLAPKSTLQYLARGWRHFGLYIIHLFYLEAEFVILHPALIHYEFGDLAIGRMHIKDLLDCRITVSFRGSDINISKLDEPDYYRQIWEQADALHLVSEDLWKRAQQRGCPSDKPHSLVYPAIDTLFFTPGTIKLAESVGIPSRPYRILSVGRLVWVKGYEYALQAIKWLVEQGISCEYHIIGDGVYSEAVKFTIYDFDLGNVVTLLGPGSRSEVKEQSEWADVFFHASVSEGFPVAVLEAQAMGLPIVCTDAGGLGENVADEETGFVVPRRNWHTMAEKLALLATNPELRGHMGEAGRQRVIEKFQKAPGIAGFDRFYREVFL